jgi:hypothetical protein
MRHIIKFSESQLINNDFNPNELEKSVRKLYDIIVNHNSVWKPELSEINSKFILIQKEFDDMDGEMPGVYGLYEYSVYNDPNSGKTIKEKTSSDYIGLYEAFGPVHAKAILATEKSKMWMLFAGGIGVEHITDDKKNKKLDYLNSEIEFFSNPKELMKL